MCVWLGGLVLFVSWGWGWGAQWAEVLNAPLSETDPELFDIIEKEKKRQRDNIVLIASEVCRRCRPACPHAMLPTCCASGP